MATPPPNKAWTSEIWSRWARVPRISQTMQIGDHSLVCFKVPVASRHEAHFAESAVWNVQMVCSRLVSKKLRLIIDATLLGGSEELHRHDDWEDWDVDLMVLGGKRKKQDALISRDVIDQKVPRPNDVDVCVNRVRSLWSDHANALLGVFSLDGYNNAGLICIALAVEVGGLSLQEAIHHFAQARPPGIFRASHRDFLERRYAVRLTTSILPPPPKALDYYDDQNAVAEVDADDTTPQVDQKEPSRIKAKEEKRPNKRPRIQPRTIELAVQIPGTNDFSSIATFLATANELPSRFQSTPDAFDKDLTKVMRATPVHLSLQPQDEKARSKFVGFLKYLTERKKAAVLARPPSHSYTWYLEPQAYPGPGDSITFRYTSN